VSLRSSPALFLALAGLASCAGLGAAAPADVPPPPPTLDEGAPAPDVAATNTADKLVHLSDFHGKPLLLFFYPVDFGSSGTAEAEEFKADHARYRALGVNVVGVSTDEVTSHRDFIARYKLPFPLLSDGGGTLARAFRVPLEGGTTRHYTFLIDRRGVIRKVWRNVRAWGHSAEVLAYLHAAK
jgi:peroxiredoxin Q/BCP